MNKDKILISFRWILGILFIYAGVRKLIEPLDFADAIAGFQMLPDHLIYPVAIGLPIFEIVLGIIVMIPKKQGWLKVGALGIALLNIAFIVILLSALFRGLSVQCGCFGFGIMPPSEWDVHIAIVRDITFLIIASICYKCLPYDLNSSSE